MAVRLWKQLAHVQLHCAATSCRVALAKLARPPLGCPPPCLSPHSSRADLGTGDELGLDVLINMLQGFSREHIGIKQCCIGGQNDDWPVPESEPLPEVRREGGGAIGRVCSCL